MNNVRVNGAKIRTAMKEQGMTLWWVAEASGLHRSTLRRWLNGKIKKVNQGNLSRVAAIVEVPIEELVCSN